MVLSKFMPEYSGAAVRTKALYEYILKRYNYENVRVICGSTENFYPRKYVIGKFCVLRLPSYLSRNNLLIRLASQIILNLSYIIYLARFVWMAEKVHIIGNDTVTVSVLFLAKLFGKKIIYEAVTQKAGSYQRLFGLIKINFPKTASIIAISDRIAQRIYEQGFSGEVWSRANPIDLQKFCAKSSLQKAEFKKQISISDDRKILMFIGKFMPGKRQDLLLEIVKELPKIYFLVMAGPVSRTGKFVVRDKNYFANLESYVDKNNLHQRVKIIPEYVEGCDYIPFADYYLSFSDSEGLGNTVLEAVVSEVSVLASNKVPSFCEHIGNLRGSYVLPPNPKFVAKKILDLANNKQVANFCRLDAQEVGEKVCHESIYANYEKLIT